MPNLKARDILALQVVKVGTTHMNVQTRGRIAGQSQGRINQHGRTLAKDSSRKAKVDLLTTHCDQPRASSPINDNCCVKGLQAGLLARKRPERTMNILSPKTVVNLL